MTASDPSSRTATLAQLTLAAVVGACGHRDISKRSAASWPNAGILSQCDGASLPMAFINDAIRA
jgi:hypothetical protein